MNNDLSLENWQYYLGNHKQFYNGRLSSKNPTQELNRTFNSYNVCGEIVDHYVNALVGQPFNCTIKAKDGSVSDRAQARFSQWLEWQQEESINRDLGDPLVSAVTQMLVADRGDGIGTGYLRVYTPKSHICLEPYQKVLFHSPTLDRIKIERDRDGIACHAEYLYGDGEVETYTLLNNGATSIKSKGLEKIANYGGRLPVLAINGKCLISDAIKRGQRAINHTLTYKNKNLESAGLFERTVLNALPPGQWHENPLTGGLEYILDSHPLNVGCSNTTFISGIPIGDPRSPKGYTNPSLNYKTPVETSNFSDNIRIDTSTMYRQTGLAHLIASDIGSISGASRQSLKDDFLCRLGIYKPKIEGTLNRLFAIVIKTLATSYPELKGCRAVVKLNLAVTASISERQENLQDVSAGVMSIPTAIAKNGFDVATELKLIKKDAYIINSLNR